MSLFQSDRDDVDHSKVFRSFFLILTASENYVTGSRQNLSGWRHGLPESLCESLCRNYESSMILQQLQTADAGRDLNHKGFVNNHNQTE